MASTNEEKLKHLEFIQSAVARMSANSFLIKGWSVTLVAAIFALAAKDANSKFALVAFFPITLFWGLDAYYLSQERKYRDLFREVAGSDSLKASFDMDASRFDDGGHRWRACLVSVVVWPFYVFFVILIMLVMALIVRASASSP